MGLLNRIRTVLGLGTIAPPDPASLLRWAFQQEAGIVLTREEALRVSAVWGCIDYIVRAIAPAPWKVYEVDSRNDSRTRRYRPDDGVGWLLNNEANPECTAISVKEALLWSALSWDGNGYAEIEFDIAGRPIALWPIESDRVTPKRVGGELGFDVRQPHLGGLRWLPAWRVYHLKGPALSGYLGENIVSHASRAIGVAAAAQVYAAGFYKNGSVPDGYLALDGKVAPASLDRLKGDWDSKYKGLEKAHGTPILEGGMKFVPLATDPEKSQLLATRQFSVEDVCRFFGVPPIKAGVAASAQGYGSNIEQLGLQVVNDCLRPWAKRLEEEADRKLFPRRAPWRQTSIDLSAHLRGDAKSRAEANAIYRNAGVLSANEIRESEGWNTIGAEGDVRLVSNTMVPVARAIAEPAEPVVG